MTHIQVQFVLFVVLFACPIKLNISTRSQCPPSNADYQTDIAFTYLLHEYRDLFIDMDVRNNRSELAIANRHQER